VNECKSLPVSFRRVDTEHADSSMRISAMEYWRKFMLKAKF